jgi:hypothetical protein
MVGTKDALAAAEATDWSEAVTLGAEAEPGLEAYINRGIVATQWVARSLGAPTSVEMGKKLSEVIATPGDRIRDFLSGALRPALLKLLSDLDAGGGTLYAALFELDDPELIPALSALGDRANVVLANGSITTPDGDENAQARQALNRAGVTVHDRMVHSGHLDHHKYLVLCDEGGSARSVWTGSTNWTKTGLCTQANNAILIHNATVAGWFKDHWDQLVAAGNGYPQQLIEADSIKRTTTIGDITITAWMAPVTGEVDLADARARIQAAKDGILFLFFNPGPEGTLLNDIIDRATEGAATYDPHLFIHGALNQDPSTSAHAVTLFHRGNNRLDGDFDVVLPENIDQRFGYWIQEIRKLPHAFAMVHSKVVVIDPFGERPVVITGSHNLGPKASRANDDNMIIIDNAPRLAAAYAVSVMTVYNQYRWRFIRNHHAQDATIGGSSDGTADTATNPPPAGWAGLQDDDTWQNEYFTSPPKIRELNFWLPPR